VKWSIDIVMNNFRNDINKALIVFWKEVFNAIGLYKLCAKFGWEIKDKWKY
jgi:hypothetical protein